MSFLRMIIRLCGLTAGEYLSDFFLDFTCNLWGTELLIVEKYKKNHTVLQEYIISKTKNEENHYGQFLYFTDYRWAYRER